jgi:nucleotide-binding universal stress UspA family protein
MDLVIMGTHGYKGLEQAIFGSVARKVVKNSPVPVLTINPYKL